MAVGAVDRSRRHHHHRNEPAINDHAESHVDDHGAVYYDVTVNDGGTDNRYALGTIDALDRAIDDYLDPAVFNKRSGPEFTAAVRTVFDAAAAILAVDVGVDSAGDRVSGPADNTIRRLPDTDDGELWRLLGKFVVHNFPSTGRELRDAVVARYGNK